MLTKDSIQILNALLTPVIASLAAYIAWQQYQVNHSSLKNQLYERRLKVFKAVMSYLAHISREGKVSHQRILEFYADASEVEFIFDDQIVEKLEELYQKGLELVSLNEQLYPSDGSQGLLVGNERSRIAKENTDLLRWFLSQIKETKDLFRQQMKIY